MILFFTGNLKIKTKFTRHPEHTADVRLILLILYFFLLFSMPVTGAEYSQAEEQPVTLPVDQAMIEEEVNDEETNPSGEDGGKMDAFHSALSSGISISADWIDSFFRDERIEIEENNSSLRLRLAAFTEKGEGVDYKIKGRLRLVLPALKDRLHLYISSIMEEGEDGNEFFDFMDEEDDLRKNMFLSLRYFIKAAERKNISVRAGVRFQDWSPALFAGSRFAYLKKWKSWGFRFIEDVTYFYDDGFESKTIFDAERPISDTYFLRAKFEGKWYERESGFPYSFTADLYETISDYQVLNYRLGAAFETSPSHRLDEILIGVRYKQRFWKKWLFFEVSPQLAFKREGDYDPSPGITVSIEAYFGKDYIKHALKDWKSMYKKIPL